MEVVPVSLLLLSLISAFLGLVAALVLLRPKLEVGRQRGYLRDFVILSSVLSFVSFFLYVASRYEYPEEPAQSASMLRSS